MSTINRTSYAMAILALLLSILGASQSGCAAHMPEVKNGLDAKPDQQPKAKPTSNVEPVDIVVPELITERDLDEYRVITWSEIHDLETGDVILREPKCVRKPSNEPCAPGTY